MLLELKAVYSNQKGFYGKACVHEVNSYIIDLYSYNTRVCSVNRATHTIALPTLSRCASNGIAAIRHCGTSASFWRSAAMSGSPTLAKGSLSRQSVPVGKCTGGRSCSDSAVSLSQPV